MPGELAVLMDQRVDLRAVQRIVVNGIGGIGCELQLGGETIVEPGTRGRVPEDRRSVGGNQQRHRHIGISLRQFHHGPAIIEHAVLVLSQPVQPLLCIQEEPFARAVEILAVRLNAIVPSGFAVGFGNQRVARGILKRQQAAIYVEYDAQHRGRDGGFLIVAHKIECGRLALLDEPGFRGRGAPGLAPAGDYVNQRRAADGNANHLVGVSHGGPAGIAFHSNGR